MTRGPEDNIFNATAGCVMLATGAAFVLIIYALLTIFALLPPESAQGLVGLTY
jgi:hypothetical protein